VEPAALHADEHRLLDERDARGVVVGEKRHERGVDRDRPLSTALRLTHAQQPPREVDVVPVEAEQFAPAEPCVRHQCEQESVAFRLAGKVTLPQIISLGLGE
jgi:hypothetical protein